MTLEETIAFMRENGESEKAIQEVKDAWELKEKERLEVEKTNGDVTDADATSENGASNTGSGSENGSSGSQVESEDPLAALLKNSQKSPHEPVEESEEEESVDSMYSRLTEMNTSHKDHEKTFIASKEKLDSSKAVHLKLTSSLTKLQEQMDSIEKNVNSDGNTIFNTQAELDEYNYLLNNYRDEYSIYQNSAKEYGSSIEEYNSNLEIYNYNALDYSGLLEKYKGGISQKKEREAAEKEPIHITVDQLKGTNRGMWAESNTAELLESSYGEWFKVTQEDTGFDVIKLKNKSNGVEREFEIGEFRGEEGRRLLHSQITGFVDNSRNTSVTADYAKRKDIWDLTGSISVEDNISYIDLNQSNLPASDRERFFNRDGEFGTIDPMGAFWSGGYNPNQIQTDTGKLEDITSDISSLIQMNLFKLRSGQSGGEFTVTDDDRTRILEDVFKSLNSSGDYLLPKDQFDKIIGGSTRSFLENEIYKHSTKWEKDRAISNEFASTLNVELKEQELKTIYDTLPEPWQKKADLVEKRSPLESKLNKLNLEISNEKDPTKLKELEALKKEVQIEIGDILLDISDLGETSGYFWDYEKEDLTSAWAAEGYSEYRAVRMAEAFEQTKKDDSGLGGIIRDIKISNPMLTDREALNLHLNKLIIDKQKIIKDGKENMVTVDLSKLGRDKKGVTKDFINKIKQRGYWSENENGEVGQVEMSVTDLMDLGFDARDFRGWFDSWQTGGAMSKEDIAILDRHEEALDYNHGATRAVYELTHLDRNPENIQASTSTSEWYNDPSQALTTFVQTADNAVRTQWFDQSNREANQAIALYGQEGTGGYTDRAMLDKMNNVASEFNEKNTAEIDAGNINPLVWTDSQLDAIKRTFADGVAEGVGDFVPTLIELAAITVVSDGALTATGAGAYLGRLRNATDIYSKMKYHTAMLTLEEIKMQTAGFKPGSGAAFYVGGALTPWFRPGALPFGVGKTFKGFDPLWNKTIKAGVVGAASGEFAAITELGIEALEGKKDFNSEMKHLFGDFEEVEQRMLTNAFVFGIAGQMGHGKIKKTDLYVSTGAKYRLRSKIESKRKNLLYTEADRIELKEFEKQEKQNEKDRDSGKISEEQYQINKQLIEFNLKEIKPTRQKKDLSEIELSRYEALERAEIDILNLATAQANAIELNPENPKFEDNYQTIVIDPINVLLKQANKNHKDLTVDFIPNELANVLFENEGSVAEYDQTNNSILFNKSKFKAGTSNHELVHMALRQVFNGYGERMEVKFTKRLDKVFEEAFGKKLNDYLSSEIKKQYTVEIDGINAELKKKLDKGEITKPEYEKGLKENEKKRKQEEFELQQEEFLTNLTEIITNPEVYYTLINNSFLKNAKQEVKQFIEESIPGMGKHFKPETPKEFVEFLGRLGDSGRKGRKMGQKILNLSKLDDISWLGIEYRERVGNGRKLSAKNLSEQKSALIESNKALLSMKPELRPKNWKDLTKKNSDRVKEINNNLRIAEANAKNIKRYKEGEPGEPLREAAANELLKDNTPIIETWFRKNFKKGLDVSESDFRSSMMEGVVNIFNSYKNFDVPFGYYLKDRLSYQLGNVLKRAQAGRTTDIAMSEMRLSVEELQIIDTSPELSRSGPEAPKGRELVRDLKIPEDVIAKAEERLGKLDVNALTYKTLKDLVPEFTNELLGVEPKPGNLGKQSVANAQKWFSKDSNARLFIDLLPEGTIPMEGAPELVKGTSTGVQNTLLKEFYNAAGRAKTKSGVVVQGKIKDITPRQVKDYFGIKTDGSFVELKNDRALSQKIKAAVDQIGKAWTNQVVRESIRNNPEFELRTSIENLVNQVQAGKSNKLSGTDIGSVYRLLEAGVINANTVIENLPAGKSRDLILNMVLDKESLTLDKDVILYNEKKNRELEGLTEKEANDISIQSEKNIVAIARKNGLSETHSSYSAISKDKNLVEWRKKLDAEVYKELGYSLEDINALTTYRKRQTVPGAMSAMVRELGFGNQARKQTLENGEQVYLTSDGKTPAQAIHDFLSIKTKTGKGKDVIWMEEVFSPDFSKTKKEMETLEREMLNSDKNYTHKEIADAKIELYRERGSYSGESKDFEATEAANTRFAREMMAAKLAVAMRHAESNYGLEWLLQDRGMQTNVTNGITKSMVYNMRSINAIGSEKGKVEATNSKGETKIKDNHGVSNHWEHALQLLNNTQFLLGIAKKHKSVTPEALKDVDRLIEASQQDLIPKDLQLFNDAKGTTSFAEFFGKEGSANLSNNALLNVFTNNVLGRMSNQYIVSGPNKGRTIAEVVMERYTNNQIKDILSKTSKKEWTELEYNLDRKLKDVDLAKTNIKNLQAMKLSSKGMSNSEIIKVSRNIDKALQLGRKKKKKARGMSTFDFDETVGISDNYVIAKKGKETKRISSAEWPFQGDKMIKEGWEMDFSDFNKVTDGKPGPLMQKMKNQIKKYGPENVFILTARGPESRHAIHEYLKSEGIEISLDNITGLGKSQGEAKAQWMLEKFAEGYNDMYFVDDALPNVEAVKKVLDQLDIKSKVQQALASKDLSSGVNDIMRHSLDIASEKTFSKAEAKIRGANIKRRRIFMTDSAADLELLLEPLYGKGKKGTENQKWFGENFVRLFERGHNDINNARQKAANGYMALRKQNKKVVKSLDQPVEGTNFTTDMALRTYIWNKNGMKIPGLAKASEAKLVEHVRNNPELQAFAENVARLTGIETGLREPSGHWWSETIASEMGSLGEGVGREKYLQDWIDAKNEIFSEENLNKMETKLGSEWRKNVEEMFTRMETGKTRKADLGKAGNAMMDYLNGSVGTIMSLNTRSATLQLISSVNFINHDFNNPLLAAKAFANQPQYWKDFAHILNSDMLKQRRSGLQINVTEAELAAAASGQKNKAKAVLAWILKQGYVPTKVCDSFAIASGGATYYRNAIRKYTKEGLSKAEAERKAWIDFQAVAERTQQSSRPDLLSAQQVSVGGRIILPFANTPMQMNRIMMKELLDIKNGRYKGFVGDNSITNKMSKVGYYGFVQSAIFAGLQSGLFALMMNSDDDELIADKKVRSVNTIADSFLRGMGIPGAVLSGIKNALLEFQKQNDKSWGADYDEVYEDLLNISPTVGSKIGKLDAAGNTYQWNKKEILSEGLTLDGPALESLTMATEALLNIPVNRVHRKIGNIQEALNEQNAAWQRIMVGMGWSQWDVGIGQRKKAEEKVEKDEAKRVKKEQEKVEAKKQVEEEKKAEEQKKKDEGFKNVRCSGTKSNGERCSITIETKAKTAKCTYHKSYKPNEGSDRNNNGIKEYQCKSLTGSGKRCKNRSENKNKKCYAHQ